MIIYWLYQMLKGERYKEKPKWYYSDWQYIPSWFLYLFIFMSTVYSIAYEHNPALHKNFSAPSGISLKINDLRW